MPLYEYQCLANGHSFEVRHPITQEPVSSCPECGSDVRRVIHPVGIVFKGSGFYATDSKGKSSRASKPTDTSSESKSSSDGKSTADTKPAGESSGSKTAAREANTGSASKSAPKPEA